MNENIRLISIKTRQDPFGGGNERCTVFKMRAVNIGKMVILPKLMYILSSIKYQLNLLELGRVILEEYGSLYGRIIKSGKVAKRKNPNYCYKRQCFMLMKQK